ncbi:UPF0280 family protein [bacterium]|nr:UPF0280 family protein [bacterium]
MRWKRHHVEIDESILTILCQPDYIQAGIDAVDSIRGLLMGYINSYPEFGRTHAPFTPGPGAPELIMRMCQAGKLAGTGPMAAVAGVVAEACVRGITDAGASEVVADNGGDIALYIRHPVTIGIYAGSYVDAQLGFRIEPRDGIFGLCTSSGTVGHSFSYGKSDAAILISQNILLADAAATAMGNRIVQPEDLEGCFDPLAELNEIEGAMAICRGKVAMWGDLPELVKVAYDTDLITRGRF